MVAIIETDRPGEGNRHVAGAHWMMVLFYGLLIVILIKTLVGMLRSGGFDRGASGVSWTLGVVLAFTALHVVAAVGAYRRRSWARTLSRVLAFLLMPVIPIGTAIAMAILRNTRPGRWISAPSLRVGY
jgi:uncharacterized membrane protein (DUF2068 family)